MTLRDPFIDNKIAELKKNIVDLQSWATSSATISESEYKARRCETVNRPAIEALTGMEIREKDSKLKPGKSHKGPTAAQITEVAVAIDNLVNGVEQRVRFEVEKTKSSGTDDTGIPSEYDTGTDKINIDLNAKAKELKEALFGQSADSISRAYFTGVDCLQIHQIGEKIRKDKNIKKTWIIGGILLVVGATAFTAIYLWRKKKSASEAEAVDEGERMSDVLLDKIDTDPEIAACMESSESSIPHVNM